MSADLAPLPDAKCLDVVVLLALGASGASQKDDAPLGHDHEVRVGALLGGAGLGRCLDRCRLDVSGGDERGRTLAGVGLPPKKVAISGCLSTINASGAEGDIEIRDSQPEFVSLCPLRQRRPSPLAAARSSYATPGWPAQSDLTVTTRMAASAPSTAATSRLTVTVTPSQSAFFAGELFTASITFSNPAPPAPSPTLHTLHSLSHLPLRSPALISPRKEQGGRWDRPPSSSHIGLAEYATSHLDSDEVPPSPFFCGNGHGTFGDGTPGASNGRKTSVDAGGGTGGGGALATPLSAAFGPLPTPRSLSGQHSPASTFASSSKPVLPTRKGLIGTPVVLQPAPPVAKHGRRMSSGGVGIYGTALRKPVSHGRAQSMAVSSPDLLERESLSRSVGKSRLGAPPAINGQGTLSDEELRARLMTSQRLRLWSILRHPSQRRLRCPRSRTALPPGRRPRPQFRTRQYRTRSRRTPIPISPRCRRSSPNSSPPASPSPTLTNSTRPMHMPLLPQARRSTARGRTRRWTRRRGQGWRVGLVALRGALSRRDRLPRSLSTKPLPLTEGP